MSWSSTIVTGLVAALVFGLIARRLGLSPIVGYLLAGVAIGPHTPGLVGDIRLASQLADIGVILLMFGVGLNFSLRDLAAVRSVAIPGALMASSLVVALGALVGRWLDWEFGPSLVFGMCLATASTVVIVRGLIELDLLGSSAGRIAIGWSVVEDLIAVILLVLLPAVSPTALDANALRSGSLVVSLFLTLGKVGLLAFVVMLGGPYVVPRLLSVVAKAQSRELFTLAVLVVALGTAFLSAGLFDVSLALGAFLGGMVVAQSDLSHQAASDALLLRDAFAVLFFLAVGMLFDPGFVVGHPGLVLAALAIVTVAKPLVAIAVMTFRGHGLRTTLSVAAGIAQVSEFSFVLAAAAVTLRILPEDARSLVLATALLSITVNPLMFRASIPLERWLSQRPAVARFLARRAGHLTELAPEASAGLRGHAVLCGYGRVGSVLGPLLTQRGIPFVVIEQDRELVEALRQKGLQVLFGDCASPTILQRAGIAQARALILTTPDGVAARLALEHARAVNPTLDAVVRFHHADQWQALRRFARTQGVHGELELAYAMARLMLQKFGVSAIEAEATVIDTRRAAGIPGESRTRIVELRVPDGSPFAGRRIAELGLPRGVLIVTIARGGEFVVPSGSTVVAAEDALLVLADPESARAIEQMATPVPGTASPT